MESSTRLEQHKEKEFQGRSPTGVDGMEGGRTGLCHATLTVHGRAAHGHYMVSQYMHPLHKTAWIRRSRSPWSPWELEHV